MKKIPFNKLTIANLTLNLFIVLLSINMLTSIYDFIDKIVINPNSFEFKTEECSGKKYIGPINGAKFYINPIALENNPNIELKLLKRHFLSSHFFHLVYFFIALFFLLQLKQLINSIFKREFYNEKSLSNLRNVAYLIFASSLIHFFAYQAMGIYFPRSVIVNYYNYHPLFISVIPSLKASFEIFPICMGFIFLIFSIVVGEAIALKSQADLTI